MTQYFFSKNRFFIAHILYSLVCVLLITLANETAKADAPEISPSKNESKTHRSNIPFFWGFAREWQNEFFDKNNNSASTTLLKDILSAKNFGYVDGDMHNGNTSVIPAGNKMVKVVIDSDGFYFGPQLFDFIGFIAILKIETERDIKYRDILNEYVRGLNGQEPSFVPHKLRKALKTTKKNYNEMTDLYVNKKIDASGIQFKYAKDEIEKIPTTAKKNKLVNIFQDLISDAKILDVAIRPILDGGSKDNLRYWVLVEFEKEPLKGAKRIYEFSRFQNSGVDNYKKHNQLSPQDLFNKFIEVNYIDFAPPEDLRLVTINDEYFIQRPKKIEVFEIPEYKDTPDEYIALSLYNINEQGRRHRVTATDAYIDLIAENQEAVLEIIKQFTKDYLERLEALQKNRK